MCESIYKKRKELKFKYTRKKNSRKNFKTKKQLLFFIS